MFDNQLIMLKKYMVCIILASSCSVTALQESPKDTNSQQNCMAALIQATECKLGLAELKVQNTFISYEQMMATGQASFGSEKKFVDQTISMALGQNKPLVVLALKDPGHRLVHKLCVERSLKRLIQAHKSVLEKNAADHQNVPQADQVVAQCRQFFKSRCLGNMDELYMYQQARDKALEDNDIMVANALHEAYEQKKTARRNKMVMNAVKVGGAYVGFVIVSGLAAYLKNRKSDINYRKSDMNYSNQGTGTGPDVSNYNDTQIIPSRAMQPHVNWASAHNSDSPPRQYGQFNSSDSSYGRYN